MVYALLVGHFVGDFLCQSDWMALNKSKRWDALAVHAFVYTLMLGVAVYAVNGPNPPAFLLVNFAAHFLTDAVTSRITSRLWFVSTYPRDAVQVRQYFGAYPFYARFTETRHWFFVAIGADQLIHMVTLIATAEWLL